MLTREQMIVAADENFMDDEQLSYIRQLLLDMRLELYVSVSTDSAVAEQKCPDKLDQAAVEEQWMVQITRRAHETDLLNDIDKALHRVTTGEYGYCEFSGEPIDINRLLANPVSTTTIEEQTRLENQKRQVTNDRFD